MANATYGSDKITIEFDDTALAEPGAELAALRIGSDGQVRTRVHGGSEAVAGAEVLAAHLSAIDHSRIPTADQAAALAAYQAALAAANTGEVLAKTMAGVEFAAPARLVLYLTQSGTDAPIIQQVYINGLGGAPSANRANTGYYRIVLPEFDNGVVVATATCTSPAIACFVNFVQVAGTLRIYTKNTAGANADGLLDHIIAIELV